MAVATVTLARPPYSKRDLPSQYDRGWFSTELSNIQRAFYPSTVRRIGKGVYLPTVHDNVLLVDASGGSVSISLPQPMRVHGLQLWIKRLDNVLGNSVTLLGTIDGVANPLIAAQYGGMQIVADETGWWNLGNIP